MSEHKSFTTPQVQLDSSSCQNTASTSYGDFPKVREKSGKSQRKRDLDRSTALNWLTSYLSERQQYLSVNGNTSDQLKISCGVPQGSVLGSLLFLICINDLPNVSKFLSFFLLLTIQTFTLNHVILLDYRKL